MPPKPPLCCLALLLMLTLSGGLASAQDSASVTWNLTANTAVSQTVGDVTGASERFSYSATDSSLCLQVRDYNISLTGGGQRLNLGQKTWPNETAENFSRYVQFAVSPKPGKSFHVTSITLDLGGGGTSAMWASVSCAIDSSFSFRVLLEPGKNLPNGAWVNPAPSFSNIANLAPSQTLYVRVSPWYNSSNASTSKYLYIRNVTISGTTTDADTTAVPMVTTAGITNIGPTSAIAGGTITWNGGLPVTACGVCWSTSSPPTIQDARTSDSVGTGTFVSTLAGLTEGSLYYVRAYATNSRGTGYGNEQAFVARTPPPSQLAFPGAEGYGKYTLGGRGGAVCEVTNLNDNGTGSLRAAVEAAGPRTVIFRVSGTIILNSPLTIINPFITIAGQTAPGDGICLRRYPLVVNAPHVIIRYVRVRLGDESGGETDAMSCRWQKNVIIDHCSVSWSEDEALSFYWCDSLTIQWCLISESLYNSNHPKGAHGYGGIWGGSNSTYHHNLLAHHSSRNPRFASGSGNTDHRNNVIYNWGFNSAYGGEAHDSSWASPFSTINVVGNYYKPGPATKSGVVYRILNPSTRNGLADYGRWHVADNVVEGYPNATADNWTYGVQGPSASDKDSIRSNTPFACTPIAQQTAEDAYRSVVTGAGARLPRLDSVDLRILHDVTTGTARYEGTTYRTVQGFPASAPTTGIIDSQNDVGGWPVLNSTPPPVDTDHDGMPDDWESVMGLSASDPTDRNGIGPDGYTNLEHYLNFIGGVVGVPDKPATPEKTGLMQNFPNPFNPTTKVRYVVGPVIHHVKLAVYDLLGREVRVLAEKNQPPGEYQVEFNSTGLASGVYIYRLTTDGYCETRKMVVLR
jgi:pectate lyase